MYILTEEELKTLLEQRAAPTVSDKDLNEKILVVTFYRHLHMTICVIELANGFFLIGAATPAAPENFNEDIGRHYAFLDARQQMWKLEGYLLRQQLYEEANVKSD